MVTLHYCGQELESWNLYTDKSSCEGDACGDEMDKNDPCCEDEIVVAKVSSDQDVTSFKNIAPKVLITDVTLNHQNIEVEHNNLQAHTSLLNSANAPPELWQNIPLFKLYSNFTYYG